MKINIQKIILLSLLLISSVIPFSALAVTAPNATYTFCSYQNGFCAFTGLRNVAYGSDGHFFYKPSVENGINCTNLKFGGDPAPGITKGCFIAPFALTPPTTEYTFCANENGHCSFAGVKTVAYGNNNEFFYKTNVASGIDCTNLNFGGDPLPGTIKGCFYTTPMTVLTKSATNITDTAAKLIGSIIPKNYSVAYFRYSPGNPYPPVYCGNIYGSGMTATNEVWLGSDTIYHTYETNISNLEPNTTYYYCAIASNQGEITYGDVKSFTTKLPLYSNSSTNASIITNPAGGITGNSAYLYGFYNSNHPSNTFFEYRKKTTFTEFMNSVGTATQITGAVKNNTGSSIGNILSNTTIANQIAGAVKNGNTNGINNLGNIDFNQGIIQNNLGSINGTATTSSGSSIKTNPWIVVGKVSHNSANSGAMSHHLTGLASGTYEYRAAITAYPKKLQKEGEVSFGDTLTFQTGNLSNSFIGNVPDNNTNGNTNTGSNNGNNGANQNSNAPLTLGQKTTPPELAIVRYHEGIETVLARQIVADDALSRAYGYADGQDLQNFAWTLADNLAKQFGYVSPSGKEIRVSAPDIAAYQLEMVGKKLTIYEYYNNKIVNVQSTTGSLRGKYNYEYYFNK